MRMAMAPASHQINSMTGAGGACLWPRCASADDRRGEFSGSSLVPRPRYEQPESRDRKRRPGSQRAAVVVVGGRAAGVEAANAETAAMSCTDMLATTDFISSAQGPRRAPVFMSKSCRIV